MNVIRCLLVALSALATSNLEEAGTASATVSCWGGCWGGEAVRGDATGSPRGRGTPTPCVGGDEKARARALRMSLPMACWGSAGGEGWGG